MAQGEVLQGELAGAAAEEREEAEQVEHRADHGARFSPDQREDHRLAAGRGFGEGQVPDPLCPSTPRPDRSALVRRSRKGTQPEASDGFSSGG